MCSSHTISGVAPGSARASRHGFEHRAKACAAAGYAGLWMHFRDYLEQREQGHDDAYLRETLDECGLEQRGVEFLTGWFLEDDEAARDAERAAFAAAGAIGARVVNVGADFELRGISHAKMIARFEALCARALDRGLSIALEIVPWSNVPDIRTALDYLAPPNAGLVIDSWHMFRGNVPLADVAALPAGKVFCVQVNDALAKPAGALPDDTTRRLPCGEGELDLAGFAAALDAAGVAIPYSVEIISPAFAALPLEEAASRSLRTAEAVFG